MTKYNSIVEINKIIFIVLGLIASLSQKMLNVR